MSKIIEIFRCTDCPHLEWDDVNPWCCYGDDETMIETPNGIPNWCTLEDRSDV